MSRSQPSRFRVSPLHAVLALAAVVLTVGAAAWWIDHSGVVVTSDARVRAKMITLSSDVAGRILVMSFEAGEEVKAGDVILRLDDREARLAFAAASLELKALESAIQREKLRVDLARARGSSRIDGRLSSFAAANADAIAARVALETAEASYIRTRSLHTAGLVTLSAMDRVTTDLEAARQALAHAEAAIGEGRAGIGEAEAEAGEAGVIERNVETLVLQSHALRQRIALLKVELEHHTTASPLSGVIDEVFVDQGEQVAAGARLALAHARDGLWIEANIKETDIARFAVGALVDIHLDAARESCSGQVQRIGEAATSEFALIPNANPTGVFTNITQRVPVRISIGSDCTQVRPGAMATLKIRAS